jgi:hypothetical protein
VTTVVCRDQTHSGPSAWHSTVTPESDGSSSHSPSSVSQQVLGGVPAEPVQRSSCWTVVATDLTKNNQLRVIPLVLSAQITRAGERSSRRDGHRPHGSRYFGAVCASNHVCDPHPDDSADPAPQHASVGQHLAKGEVFLLSEGRSRGLHFAFRVSFVLAPTSCYVSCEDTQQAADDLLARIQNRAMSVRRQGLQTF